MKLTQQYKIGDKVRVKALVSFHYEFDPERWKETQPDSAFPSFDIKPRVGDKKVFESISLTPFEAFVVGIVYKQTGTLDAYSEGASFEEPGYSIRYLRNITTHPCILIRKFIRGKQLMALATDVEKLEESTCLTGTT